MGCPFFRPTPNPSTREGNIITCWYKPQIARIHTDYYFLARNTQNARNTTFLFLEQKAAAPVFSAQSVPQKKGHIFPSLAGGTE